MARGNGTFGGPLFSLGCLFRLLFGFNVLGLGLISLYFSGFSCFWAWLRLASFWVAFFYELEKPSGLMVFNRLGGGPRLGRVSIVFMVAVLQQGHRSGL